MVQRLSLRRRLRTRLYQRSNAEKTKDERQRSETESQRTAFHMDIRIHQPAVRQEHEADQIHGSQQGENDDRGEPDEPSQGGEQEIDHGLIVSQSGHTECPRRACAATAPNESPRRPQRRLGVAPPTRQTLPVAALVVPRVSHCELRDLEWAAVVGPAERRGFAVVGLDELDDAGGEFVGAVELAVA